MGSGTDQNDSVVSSIIAKLKNVPDESSLSYIHKVPTIFRKGYEEYYTPRLVSLGPFHHGSESLRRMEIHKWRYLKDFLRRNPERNINSYVESLRGHTARALQFYGEPINLKSHEFIEMMLIDGCFILEFMFRSINDRELPDDTDPLFTTAWMRSIIEQDMILLENQVPFFVIECLYTSPGPNGTACASFLELSFKFLDPYLLKDLVDFLRSPHHQVKHFVDLLRQCTIPTLPRASPKSDRVDRLIPSATVLHAAGIRFTRGESKSIMDISFSKHGVFNIPHFVILDSTELFYRNVMAFEHFDQYPSFITNYTSLMNQLIDTPDDVALLRRYGIMDHLLGDDEDVSDLFNRIGTGTQVNTGQFHYTKLMEDVNAYRDRRRNVWRAKLVSEYFNTPWSTISFIAALVLLICTILQTVFTVIPS